MGKLPINEVLQVCRDFITQPTNEDAITNFGELQVELQVREYIPINEKVLLLFQILLHSDKPIELHSALFTTALELACCFHGLLAYTNIELDNIEGVRTYDNYDALYQSGLAEYILKYCQQDYDRLMHLLDRSVSFENLRDLTQTIGKMEPYSISELTAAYKDLKKELNPKVTSDMADIVRYNDPQLYDIKHKVLDEAMEAIERADKLEKNKVRVKQLNS